MAFDPRGRFSWSRGRLNNTAGTGVCSIEGRVCFAEPCRPSIHSTWRMAESGTSSHGIPAEVTSFALWGGPLGGEPGCLLGLPIQATSHFRENHLAAGQVGEGEAFVSMHYLHMF